MFLPKNKSWEKFCRICQDEEVKGMITSPCLCKGSLGYVHTHCLNQWMIRNQQRKCEICLYPVRAPHQPLLSWLRTWLFYHLVATMCFVFLVVKKISIFTLFFLATLIAFNTASKYFWKTNHFANWLTRITDTILEDIFTLWECLVSLKKMYENCLKLIYFWFNV